MQKKIEKTKQKQKQKQNRLPLFDCKSYDLFDTCTFLKIILLQDIRNEKSLSSSVSLTTKNIELQNS